MQPKLSPDPRKIILAILNPVPDRYGIVRETISLAHAIRHCKRHRAYIDPQNRVVFGTEPVSCRPLAQSGAKYVPTPPRVLPMEMSNRTGSDLRTFARYPIPDERSYPELGLA